MKVLPLENAANICEQFWTVSLYYGPSGILPSTPSLPLYLSAGLHTVSSLPVAPSQVLITPSPPPWLLPETFLPIQVPGLLFVCLFRKVFVLSPSMPHLCASPPPFSSLYTLVCWHVLCLSSLWRLFRLLIKDRSPPQQKVWALPLNKQFISLLSSPISPIPPTFHPTLRVHVCACVFTPGLGRNMCTC